MEALKALRARVQLWRFHRARRRQELLLYMNANYDPDLTEKWLEFRDENRELGVWRDRK